MLAAIAIVFMLLIATFRSLAQPLLLLVSVPFLVTGAIVLIDLINQYCKQGWASWRP